MLILKTLSLFILAGICEIGGGYLIWLWLKDSKPLYYGVLGGIIIICYGIIATLHPLNFARAYAAYSGFFILMSFIWAYKFDNYTPDKYDIIGTLVVIIGVCIISYSPRITSI